MNIKHIICGYSVFWFINQPCVFILYLLKLKCNLIVSVNIICIYFKHDFLVCLRIKFLPEFLRELGGGGGGVSIFTGV